MKACFYDIECFDNVYSLCNFIPHENVIELFYLSDDPALTSEPDFKEKLTARIHEKNKNFTGEVRLLDLHKPVNNEHLAKTFGLSDSEMVNNKANQDSFNGAYRLVCDTDPDFDDDKYPYFMGYNSYNYDTTVLAYYLTAYFLSSHDSSHPYMPVSAHEMYLFNNELFEDENKNAMYSRLRKEKVNGTWRNLPWSQRTADRVRSNMIYSGRHVDVARLNEKQQHVGLKRLIGMMGGQILESDKLSHNQFHIDDADQFYDLMAYNVSDCVNLDKYVFHDRDSVYYGKFELKRGLLRTYPELVYIQITESKARQLIREQLLREGKPDNINPQITQQDIYKPDIDPASVRRDRLTIDSSSAQFATKALCPYGHLHDIETVSFLYPSEKKSKELGIPRVNVLEEAKKFFYEKFQQPELRAEFDRIYRYYKNIEGKNFNSSENYRADYPDGPIAENITDFSRANTCMFYYKADGTPSTCFVTFSIGGIHGAEYNDELYKADIAAYEEQARLFAEAKAQYPDPLDLKAAKTIDIRMPDGSVQTFKSSYFLKSGSTKKKSEYKDIEKNKPALFQANKKGSYELKKRYVYTSADETNHEDFTSYYPNLLRMMSAFYNEGLGYDRYAEIFEQKQKLGKVMKNKSLPKHDRDMASVQREGTKLVLNSASGAADANFESNIRMNNQIISMRIIGQLFSWRIGQAQTFAGARITSTNTDGLFSVLTKDLNDRILEQESAEINVEIEPETTFLISKDSNNRIEVDHETGKIQRASGGSLACNKGPSPEKSLAHPAIIDWAMCEYLVYHALGDDRKLTQPFDDESGDKILAASAKHFDKTMLLNMYQNIISNSAGSSTYNFAIRPGFPSDPIPLQHYNRVFIMKDDAPMETFHLWVAAARKITPIVAAKRRRNNDMAQQHNDIALNVLRANGINKRDIPCDKEAVVKKITGIEPTWHMLIMNRALSDLTEAEQDEILQWLDYDKYRGLFHKSYEDNWRNKTPQSTDEPETDETDDNETLDINSVLANETPAGGSSETTPEQSMQPLPQDMKQAAIDLLEQDGDLPFEAEEPTAPEVPEETAAPAEQTSAQSDTCINQTVSNPPAVQEKAQPVSVPPIPEPSVESWLEAIGQFTDDTPFPTTPLDSEDEQELQRMGLRLIQEGWYCLKKAQAIREQNKS